MTERKQIADADGLKASIFKAIKNVQFTLHGNEKRARPGAERMATYPSAMGSTSNGVHSLPTSDALPENNSALSHRLDVGNRASRQLKQQGQLSSTAATENAKAGQRPQLQRANQNERGLKVPRAFIEACTSGNAENVRTLIKKTPSLVSYAPMLCHGYSGLHYAAKGGHHDVVRVLLDNGADVNLRTSGYTALHLAAICKRAKVIEVLLKEYRANCNVVDLSGHTFDYYAGSLMFDVWKTRRGGGAKRLCLQHTTSYDAGESNTNLDTNKTGPKPHCQNNCVGTTRDVTKASMAAPCTSNSTAH